MDDMVNMFVFEANNMEDYLLIVNSHQGKQFGFNNCTTIVSPEKKVLFCYTETGTTINIPEKITIKIGTDERDIILSIRHMIFSKQFLYSGINNSE